MVESIKQHLNLCSFSQIETLRYLVKKQLNFTNDLAASAKRLLLFQSAAIPILILSTLDVLSLLF